MDSRALLQHQLSTSHQIVKQCVNDIADGEAGRLPAPLLSPVIWQIGHLAVSNVNFIKRAGVTSGPELPERYTALFKSGTGGAAGYPPFAEVLRAFDDTHEALMRVVAEANLDTPTEGPRGMWKNFGEAFAFSSAHRWYHIGKINSLRALLGKPRIFG
ncbi:MAG TPA: DinB family protein [bacterium]|nr:DinB family protein [bacterium]